MLKVFTQFGAITITVITKNKNVISFNNNFTITFNILSNEFPFQSCSELFSFCTSYKY